MLAVLTSIQGDRPSDAHDSDEYAENSDSNHVGRDCDTKYQPGHPLADEFELKGLHALSS